MLMELLTGRPPRDSETKEPLAGAIYAQLQEPKKYMRDIADPRAGDWDAKKWRRLAVIARRCAEEHVSMRCTMVDVVAEIDALAGRRSGGGSGGVRWSFGART